MKIKPINKQIIVFSIRSTSPMVQHAWSEKALQQIRDKKAGKKTKNREVCDPEAEFHEATYTTEDGQFCIPLLAFKASFINAAHKDLGIEKTLVRKSFFIPGTVYERRQSNGPVIPIECEPPVMREDYVRVGVSGTDLRYRPHFEWWRATIKAEYDADNLQSEDIITLVNRAGFGVGIGEMRPEKGGEYGRFEVDTTQPMEVSNNG